MKKLLPFLLFSLPAFADLTVHEWGTFTSVMDSKGERLEGLHLEEEPLPSFVYNIAGPTRMPLPHRRFCGKGEPCVLYNDFNFMAVDQLPLNPIDHGVTQKMETPVIYFYGNPGTKVDVTIDFPQGLISQWYPDAQSFTPKREDANTLGPSHFDFHVTLESPNSLENIPEITSKSIWAPSRITNANVITDDQGHHEKFIFYRGVADFDAHIKVTSHLRTVSIHNLSTELIPDVFVLKTDGQKGQIINMGELRGNDKMSFFTHSLTTLTDDYIQKSKDLLVKSLVRTGLFEDESQALVNTWEKSYFKTPGLRIFYILPRSEVNRILPLNVHSTDANSNINLVRVLVGRIEVITEEEELSTFEQVREQFLKRGIIPASLFTNIFGRFALPKAIRIKQLIGDSIGISSSIYSEMLKLISSKTLEK